MDARKLDDRGRRARVLARVGLAFAVVPVAMFGVLAAEADAAHPSASSERM